MGNRITFIFSLILAIAVDFLYIYFRIMKKIEIGLYQSFCFNWLLYFFVNAFVFIGTVGSERLCGTDGQVIFAIFATGMISSCIIFINGIIIDVIVEFKINRKK
jgi:hypothetical protein